MALLTNGQVFNNDHQKFGLKLFVAGRWPLGNTMLQHTGAYGMIKIYRNS